MDVVITLKDDHLTVVEMGKLGEIADIVKPGDKWRGWKYSRLRRKGNGVHSLIGRGQEQQGGIVLELRGHE
jgi:hypothetical protein